MTIETDTDMAKALRELTEACEAEFCCPGTDDNEPDDSKVSYPEETCNITFGMIRRARAALEAHESRAQPASVPDGQIAERLDILRRICTRGKNYFVETQDSMGVDLFDHMATEVGYLAGDLGTAPQPPANGDE